MTSGGSSGTDSRSNWRHRLSQLGGSLLVAAMLLAAPSRAAGPAPKVRVDWNALLADYRTYGLPLPPSDAALALVDSGWSHVENGENIPIRSLGFVLESGKDGAIRRVLVGTEVDEPDGYRKAVLTEPKVDVVAQASPEWGKPVFAVKTGVATAIQCKARGWDELAEALLAASLKTGAGHHFSQFYQPAGEPPRLALARVALAHWANELLLPGSDRASISRHLAALLEALPELRDAANRGLLKSLRAALVPSKAAQGSVEALVDALVDLPYAAPSGDRETDPRLLRLENLGFRAVPALIEHLDDERLTRTVKIGFNNFPTYHQRVGMVASDVLQALAGEEVGKNWLERQTGSNVEKRAARAWWARAKKLGEEAHVVQRVLPSDAKDRFPNEVLLRIMAARYPWRLGKTYQTILRSRQYVVSWPLAEAIAKSSLPVETKRALLSEGANSKDLEHRRYALRQLEPLDRPTFLRILLRTLVELPATTKGDYWLSPESAFTGLVTKTDDPRAWELLLRVAKRSDLGLRMQIIGGMGYGWDGDPDRDRRLRFLEPFLADATVRDNRGGFSGKWGGPHAGFTFPRLEVRNLTAMEAAQLLGVKGEPKPKWTDAQWLEFRAAVTEALHRTLGVQPPTAK